MTAACTEIPPPLLEQLTVGGKLIAPVKGAIGQDLTVFEKSATGVSQKLVCTVLYVNLRGQYGVAGQQESKS
jgi:protein-L-isoaspartate(D-aspartate) O-methyltransferase